MLTHYLRTGWRNLRRNPIYSLINVLGLSLGIAACVLIFLFVQDEFTYDSFHANGERIYRLLRHPKPDMEHFDLNRGITPYMPTPLGPAFEAEVPGVAHAVRVRDLPAGYADIQVGSSHFSDGIVFADSTFFRVFSFPLVAGDTATALSDPTSAVISREIATKYFGDTNPIGQNFTLSVFQDEPRLFRVTGVLANYPGNSSLRPDILIPLKPNSAQPSAASWFNFNIITFALLQPAADPKQVESAISALFEQRRIDAAATEPGTIADNPFFLTLQPLRAMHLDHETGESLRTYSYILGGIALAILLLAAINFATLAVARAMTRAREIGVRQVFGAVSKQLIGQQLIEVSLLCGIATAVGLTLAELALPIFNNLTEKSLSLHLWSNWPLALCILALAALLTLVAGIIPAGILARLHPATIFRREAKLRRNGPIVRTLVVVQYALSITLLICLMGMARQQHYVRTKPLGFNPDQIVAVINHNRSETGDAILDRLRHELTGESTIRSIAACGPSFTRGWNKMEWEQNGKRSGAMVMRVDPAFVPTLQMEIVVGRNFEDRPSDRNAGVLVNEAFVCANNLADPVGSAIVGYNGGENLKSPQILGVVKDFHILSLRDQIEPALFYWSDPEWYDAFLARVDGADLQIAIGTLEHAWAKASPGARFEYRFLDDDLATQYRSEQRWLTIISYSSAVAMVIALLGLFGLAGVSAVRRQKELSVRKVLGAGIPQLLSIVNREFLVLIVLANLIAWPVAYYVLGRWLQNFAYRTEIAPWTFAAAAIGALILATAVISAHTLRAASTNPITVLRQE